MSLIRVWAAGSPPLAAIAASRAWQIRHVAGPGQFMLAPRGLRFDFQKCVVLATKKLCVGPNAGAIRTVTVDSNGALTFASQGAPPGPGHLTY